MNGKARFVGALLGALCLTTIHAQAGEPDAASKADAAKRFDRGLTLFDEGDNAGALAEFKQVYSTMPNPVVLYNIGLVYAAMFRPVEAVDALKQVVNESALSPAQHERAQNTLTDQEARIGRLSITTVPPGAHISIDNVDVATTPLSAPLRVAAGTHVVGAVAEGYALGRKEVMVAGNADASLNIELLRAEATRDANLTIRSRVPAAEVVVNGKSAGKTPLATSVSVPPGHITVELRRPGYTSAKQEVDLTEGATSDITLDPSIDSKALPSEGVFFALDVGHKDADLFVDQEHIGPYTAPIRLPKGPHRVRVETAGFMPLERDVTLGGDKNNVLTEKLEPTPETRAAHDSSVKAHRIWGFVGIGAGALIAGGGAAFAAISHSSKNKAAQDVADANDAHDLESPPHCNFRFGTDQQLCLDDINNAQASYDSAKTRELIGFVGIGVGVAAIATGVIVLLTGPSANEYGALEPEKARRSRFALTGGPGNFGAALTGSF
ncbi:MAG TPA: PEGA domain-containing protein [Polyangiaceae bacterium]|nr:PEGA domain-containing protein [Polyangiaceae bacterium]